MNNIESKIYKFLIPLLLIIYFSLFFSQQIFLIRQDLGRHIINGKIFLQTGQIISTNFYSYTEPNFPTINHHWLGGVILYLVQNTFGFTGLSIFYLAISGLTVYIFFLCAKRKSNFVLALLITFLLLPIMANRKEIRPEGFSNLFIGIYYYLITLFLDKKIKFIKLFSIISLIQLVWVNTHIFFIFGIFITSTFAFIEFVKVKLNQKDTNLKLLLILAGTTIIVSLANPYGIKGLIEPFNIFKEYGYAVLENQSLIFMQKFSPDLKYIFVGILSLIYVYVIFNSIVEKKLLRYGAITIITGIFMIMAWKIMRIIPLFGMILVPFLTQTIYEAYKEKIDNLPKYTLLILLISFVPRQYFSAFDGGSGFGLAKNINASAEFFKNNNLKGPIFNNYDIGGYLIYHLYDREKVFTDKIKMNTGTNKTTLDLAGMARGVYVLRVNVGEERYYKKIVKE